MDSRLHRNVFSAGLVLLGLASMAHADNGVLLAGNSVCSQQVQSTALYFVGGTTTAKVTWTAFMSTAATGPAKQLFQAVFESGDQFDISPSTPGTYFFHVCITNTSTKTVNYDLWVAGKDGAVAPLVGPNTATLGPQATACAEFTISLANRIGKSTEPVLWYMEEYDGCGNLLGDGNTITTTDINDTVAPGPGAYESELCVTNTSTSTATVSFQLVSQ
jgi:hypothetical protein